MMNESQEIDASPGDREAGLIFGVVLDGHGGGQKIDFEAAKSWTPKTETEVLWLHLDRTKPDVPDWLEKGLGISDATADVLVSNETRPRAFREDDTLVAMLRGLNFNPGDEPEDMIAMQLWSDGRRVLTLRRRRLQTPRDIRTSLIYDNGPKTAGELVSGLIEALVSKMNRVILDLNNRIDDLEDDAETDKIEDALDQISGIRRNCLALKRYMSPQHEALMAISRDAPDWMDEDDRRNVRETIARLQRYLDDLDVSKESALVIQDDLNSRANSQSNKTMYMLSIVAAIFLPLSFITGLLGINVGGMPGVESTNAFWVTVTALVVLLLAQVVIFRKLKWL